MLALLVFLPIAAFVAILLGAPARVTAIGAAAVNLALGLYAACTWHCSCWTFLAAGAGKARAASGLWFSRWHERHHGAAHRDRHARRRALRQGPRRPGKTLLRILAAHLRRGARRLRRHRPVFLLRLPRTRADPDVPHDRHARPRRPQGGRLENHHLSGPRLDHPASRAGLARQPHRHLRHGPDGRRRRHHRSRRAERASPPCCWSASARSSRSSRSTRGPPRPMPARPPRSPCCTPAC